MPERVGPERGAETPISAADEAKDRQALTEFRRRTEGLRQIIEGRRGSEELAGAVNAFLAERGFPLANVVELESGLDAEHQLVERSAPPATGVEVVAKPGNEGVLITVYGLKRRLDIDPDDWPK